MNRWSTAISGLALTLATGTAVLAKQPPEREVEAENEPSGFAEYEEVQSITAFSRLHSFNVIDRDSIIVWRTSRDPYLVELRLPSFELGFAHNIGLTSWGSRVHAGFDDVIVDGMRYPIDKIYRLTREQAKQLTTS